MGTRIYGLIRDRGGGMRDQRGGVRDHRGGISGIILGNQGS